MSTKTTAEWLAEVKSSPAKLNHWLTRQYIGEALATGRIHGLIQHPGCQSIAARILTRIVNDEARHTAMVASLLVSRELPLPTPSHEDTRYWRPMVEHGDFTFGEFAAIGHHAETMRLSRIAALAADDEIDSDIREVFQQILPDEENHAKWFNAISTPSDVEAMRAFHERGLELLGLEV